MNLEKMRRNLVRNIPDNEERTFDPMKVTDLDVQEFFAQFNRKMVSKHGKNFKESTAFQSQEFDTNLVRVQLVAHLRSSDGR